jgi:hypothetical protein
MLGVAVGQCPVVTRERSTVITPPWGERERAYCDYPSMGRERECVVAVVVSQPGWERVEKSLVPEERRIRERREYGRVSLR